MDFKTEHIVREGINYIPFDYGINFNNSEFKEFNERHLKNNLIINKILDSWEPSRNYDFLLFFEYLRTKYPEVILTSGKDYIIFKLPRKLIWEIIINEYPDVSGRIRRKIQSKGNYLPTRKDVIVRRSKSEKFLRKILK